MGKPIWQTRLFRLTRNQHPKIAKTPRNNRGKGMRSQIRRYRLGSLGVDNRYLDGAGWYHDNAFDLTHFEQSRSFHYRFQLVCAEFPVFRTNSFCRFVQGALTWSAVLTLLVQPISLPTAKDCGCCARSAATSQTVAGCSASLDTNRCCTPPPKTCCSRKRSCCSDPRAKTTTVCQCGDDCRCSTRRDPVSPAPIVPTPDWQQDQYQLVWLSTQTLPGNSSLPDDHLAGPTIASTVLTLTAQQVCALLSRFTC